MPEETISLDELLAALQQAETQEGEGGLSVEEICHTLGRSTAWVRQRLRALQAQGRLVVSRRTTFALDGRLAHVPTYSLRKEQKA